MVLLAQKIVDFGVIVSLVCSIQVQALFGIFKGKSDITKDAFGDYVVPEAKNTIEYAMSDKIPQQIALYNLETKTGLVINGAVERVAFESHQGDKLVMDMRNEKLYQGISNPGLSENEFEKVLAEYDINRETLNQPFNQSYAAADRALEDRDEPPVVVKKFCICFRKLIKRIGGMICKAIKSILSPIMEVLNQFGNLLQLGLKSAFKLLRCGVLALFNIFKWLGRLLSKIVGGIGVIVNAGIKLVLDLIVSAANGAQALWEILNCLIKHFDLMKILKFILKIPKMVCHFISGLGGKIVHGITGIFEILSAIFGFTITQLFKVVSSFIKMILDFFLGKRPTHDNVLEATGKLLNVSEQQKQKYNNGPDYKNYDEFLLATRGSNDYKVHGIPVGKVVKIVMESGNSAKKAVMAVLDELTPFAPMTETIPVLMVTMIKSLNCSEGVGYVKQLFPEIKIEDDALTATTRNLAGDLNIPEHIDDPLVIPTPDLLRKIPVVKDIYDALDKEAVKHTKSTMEALLKQEHVRQVVEFTTTVEGLTP